LALWLQDLIFLGQQGSVSASWCEVKGYLAGPTHAGKSLDCMFNVMLQVLALLSVHAPRAICLSVAYASLECFPSNVGWGRFAKTRCQNVTCAWTVNAACFYKKFTRTRLASCMAAQCSRGTTLLPLPCGVHVAVRGALFYARIPLW
jgi:hypothetical protein